MDTPRTPATLSFRCTPDIKNVYDLARDALGLSFTELVRQGAMAIINKNIGEAVRLGVLSEGEYRAAIRKRNGCDGWSGAFNGMAEVLRIMHERGFLAVKHRDGNKRKG